MTETLMTLTQQLPTTAIEKRASHPSFICEPDIDFLKLLDKLEQVATTIKLSNQVDNQNKKN